MTRGNIYAEFSYPLEYFLSGIVIQNERKSWLTELEVSVQTSLDRILFMPFKGAFSVHAIVIFELMTHGQGTMHYRVL